MDEDEGITEEQIELPRSVGEKLRAAREAKGLSLEQVAAETRITLRHLKLIEADDFGALAGRSYALGFSRTYARLVGLDDAAIVAEVREELALLAPRDNRALTFEPGDPARVPSVALAWFSALAALILFIGGAVFIWTSFISPGGSLPWLTDEKVTAEQPPTPAIRVATSPSGQVVFTALEDRIWVKFYDSDGRQLMQKEMAKGEAYAVPVEVDGPLLWTGRPDALAITIGGKPVPRLAETHQRLKDVPVSAAALLARPAAPAAPVTTPAAPPPTD